MKTALLLVALIGLFAMSKAFMETGVYKSAEHPGKCVMRPDLILDPGTHKDTEKYCAQYVCFSSGFADHLWCDDEEPPKGCTYGDYKHPDADYPECCAKEVKC